MNTEPRAYEAICAAAVAYARDINDSRRPACTWTIRRLCVVRPEIVILVGTPKINLAPVVGRTKIDIWTPPKS